MKKNIGPIRDTAAIILAGGKGKRMGIALPKSLLPLGKKTIIEHVLATLHSLPVTRIVIVTPADDSLFRKLLGGNRYSFVKQASPLGTGHAVATALHRQKFSESNVLIIMADSSALFKPGTVRQFIRQCAPESAIGITLFPAFRNVTSVGRVYLDKQHRLLGYHLRGASSRRIGHPYIQGGYLFFRTQWLQSCIHTLARSKHGDRYNLTDLLSYAKKNHSRISAYVLRNLKEWSSVNTFREYRETLQKINTRLKP